MSKFFIVSITFFMTINMFAWGTDTDCEAWLKEYEKSYGVKLADKIECNKSPGRSVIGTIIVC